jgi:hypothetical protein
VVVHDDEIDFLAQGSLRMTVVTGQAYARIPSEATEGISAALWDGGGYLRGPAGRESADGQEYGRDRRSCLRGPPYAAL